MPFRISLYFLSQNGEFIMDAGVDKKNYLLTFIKMACHFYQ